MTALGDIPLLLGAAILAIAALSHLDWKPDGSHGLASARPVSIATLVAGPAWVARAIGECNTGDLTSSASSRLASADTRDFPPFCLILDASGFGRSAITP